MNSMVTFGDEEPIATSDDLVMIADPNGPRAEAIRALRTHLVAQHFHKGRRSLAVCAASSNVGCTFVAANLGVALAQIGLKTLVIDADLRAPGLDGFLPSPHASVGLRQALSSTDKNFSSQIENDVVQNFSIIYSGGRGPNPQELLAGTRFQDLMEFCMREYDATIVDTPASNIAADSRRISSVVGYSLIVAKENSSYVDDMRSLVRELTSDQVSVVGAVLTQK